VRLVEGLAAQGPESLLIRSPAMPEKRDYYLGGAGLRMAIFGCI
jgi:hypothetical protein